MLTIVRMMITMGMMIIARMTMTMKTWPPSKFGQHYHPWKFMMTMGMIIIVRMTMTMTNCH